MTKALHGFDDWLNRLLEEQARNAGEDVSTYVTRAVATQMLADMRRDDHHQAEELMSRLVAGNVFAPTAMPDVSAELSDPERLEALYATGLLDSPPEEVYDRISRAAADALDVPFAAVSLIDIDRQFFKSATGLDSGSIQERQTPLEMSVCQYAVANRASLILEDARTDPVFKNHPVVRSGLVVAYLGIPLIDNAGNAIGTLCVYDSKPRLWSTGHVQVLSDLASLATERIFRSAATT